MGSINRSHNESDGGIVLFSGELILLYCDSVQCELGGKESFKGRVYLTTHRLVVTMSSYRQNAAVKSFCAPFCAITKCSVEQPLFGANYIEATVRDETDPSKSFTFKLKFSKGGAIELAMAMNRAVQAVGRNYNPSMQPPPAYSTSPSAQYYQAPPTVYAPGYNSGIQMPVQQFPDQPPIGFIYASEAPPPYPGLNGNQGPNQQKPPQGYPPNTGSNYPGNPQQQQPAGYPGQQQQWSGYPGQQAPGHSGPQAPGYPGHQAPGYPGQSGSQTPGYPGQSGPQAPGYPSQQAPGQSAPQAPGYSGPQAPGHSGPQAPGYPGQQVPGYPGPQAPSYGGAYPQQPPQQLSPDAPTSQPPSTAGYPNLNLIDSAHHNQSQQPGNQNAWPTAPSFNPNWSDGNKPAL